jgi:tRNA modification GTPase
LAQAKSADGDIEIDTVAAELGGERSNRATIRALCLDARQFFNKTSCGFDLPPGIPVCDMLVFTKSDLVDHPISKLDLGRAVPTVLTSSSTGEGLDELSDVLCAILASIEAPRACAVASTADRCRESIRRASNALTSAQRLAEQDQGSEFIAAEIRAALDELGKVVGAIYTEDLLDRIFSSFCIGK